MSSRNVSVEGVLFKVKFKAVDDIFTNLLGIRFLTIKAIRDRSLEDIAHLVQTLLVGGHLTGDEHFTSFQSNRSR
jgi:hypothetical protein